MCVCCTWLTCSRRAGCQPKPHHFTSPLSALHHCQEDCLSTSKKHTGCTAGSSATGVVLCSVCMSGHLFHVCKALSDQSCLLTVPVSIARDTCSRKAGCKHHNSDIRSAPKDSNCIRIRNKFSQILFLLGFANTVYYFLFLKNQLGFSWSAECGLSP